ARRRASSTSRESLRSDRSRRLGCGSDRRLQRGPHRLADAPERPLRLVALTGLERRERHLHVPELPLLDLPQARNHVDEGIEEVLQLVAATEARIDAEAAFPHP